MTAWWEWLMVAFAVMGAGFLTGFLGMAVLMVRGAGRAKRKILRKPDYAKIARLERELGIGQDRKWPRASDAVPVYVEESRDPVGQAAAMRREFRNADRRLARTIRQQQRDLTEAQAVMEQVIADEIRSLPRKDSAAYVRRLQLDAGIVPRAEPVQDWAARRLPGRWEITDWPGDGRGI